MTKYGISGRHEARTSGDIVGENLDQDLSAKRHGRRNSCLADCAQRSYLSGMTKETLRAEGASSDDRSRLRNLGVEALIQSVNQQTRASVPAAWNCITAHRSARASLPRARKMGAGRPVETGPWKLYEEVYLTAT
jgi:hypothetical protein